eukprot:s1612_g10.t1
MLFEAFAEITPPPPAESAAGQQRPGRAGGDFLAVLQAAGRAAGGGLDSEQLADARCQRRRAGDGDAFRSRGSLLAPPHQAGFGGLLLRAVGVTTFLKRAEKGAVAEFLIRWQCEMRLYSIFSRCSLCQISAFAT